MCKHTQSSQVTHPEQNRNTGEFIQQYSCNGNAPNTRETYLCTLDTSVNKCSNARVTSADHSSTIDQLVVMFPICGQHLVAGLAAVLAVLARDSVTMQTLENWREEEVSRDRHGSGTVVHTPSSSFVPSKFEHATRDYRQTAANFLAQ